LFFPGRRLTPSGLTQDAETDKTALLPTTFFSLFTFRVLWCHRGACFPRIAVELFQKSKPFTDQIHPDPRMMRMIYPLTGKGIALESPG
jgi:hypothetical protein